MCGIFGLVEPATESRGRVLGRMGEVLSHRGPDGDGTFENDRVALGARRLAINDVVHGRQPVANETGEIVAVLNGEIYNFRELRERLERRGHRIDNDSDSAIIPHLYEEHGEQFVQHLNGMFAIAIWDGRTDRLLLARDRLGQKPLYYRHVGSQLAFASELKALMLDPATSREIDLQAVSDYLSFQYVPAPRTILAQVKKVPPAHVVTVTGETAVSRQYWTLNFADSDTPPEIAREEAEEQLRHRLLESVRLRMTGERPIGAFLSGGLDSSAIVAAMTMVSSAPLATFSIGFDDPAHDESEHARRVSSLFGTDHHELTMPTPTVDDLTALARSFDEPFADSSAIPTRQLASLTSETVVVALAGDGGDEAFGGYQRYTALPAGRAGATRRLRRLAKHGILRSLSTVTGRRGSVDPLLAMPPLRYGHPARHYADLVSHFTPEQKAVALSDDAIDRLRRSGGDGVDSWRSLHRSWLDHAHTDMVNRMLAIDTSTYLPGDLLTKVDIATMAYSVEGRSPFLDHTLLEWAATLPGHWKVSGGETKTLMRSSLGPWLPSDVIDREKQGFAVPMGDWLGGPFGELLHEVFSEPAAVSEGLVRPGVHGAMLDGRLRRLRTTHIYSLLMLELWLRERWAVPPEDLR